MEDYERLGVFYLGRLYDPHAKKPTDSLLLYDSNDLVTHAVCVGMTGSGKTGLCIDLIEEAAIDNVPAIIIDPKGDLANLLLTFPNLQPGDFLPWINEDDARKKGLSPDQFAAQQAELWKNGLAKWGQDGQRIARLRQSVDMAVYTPGSTAGLPISILKSFAAPPDAVIEDAELFRDRVSGTATSLLGLLGIDADPIQSREHILISTILAAAWKEGKDVDLGALITQIQTPPVTKVGMIDVETFYPSKDRFALAMRLNNLLAAPGFDAWMQGDSLDVDALLHTSGGKPRISIFSIAHLSDAERMFFVSLMLNQMLGWVRTQSGTTSLRAILYMDEIFGFFPPVSNPPSKAPLLALLKQSRAFGLGIVLATQNPVDLDYKGLSNAGTWFIGRLQTERDVARVLDGLEGASAGAGSTFDRGLMQETIAGLGSRIFLMHNVHEDGPVVFESRWAMSYLRGPLTRTQIKTLMADRKGNVSPAATVAPSAGQASALQPVAASVAHVASSAGSERPVLPPDVKQYFVPIRSNQPADAQLLYKPSLIGFARVYFADAKLVINQPTDVSLAAPLAGSAAMINWDSSIPLDLAEADLERAPSDANSPPQFSALPREASQSKNYDAWKKSFAEYLFRGQTLALWRSNSAGLTSTPGESERDFRIRLQQVGRETRDATKEKLRQKYAPKLAALQDRRRRAEQAVDREKSQASQARWQTVISVGTTVLGAIFGRKVASAGTIGRASTAARGVGRSVKESQDIGRANENVEAIDAQSAELEGQLNTELQALDARFDPLSEELQSMSVHPKKTDITVGTVALAWMPYWLGADGTATRADG